MKSASETGGGHGVYTRRRETFEGVRGTGTEEREKAVQSRLVIGGRDRSLAAVATLTEGGEFARADSATGSVCAGLYAIKDESATSALRDRSKLEREGGPNEGASSG